MNFHEAENIPGMIELVERSMLFSTVKSLSLEKNDSIVEFGPFFGRSTYCIINGLLANNSYTSSCSFVTHDSFECDEDGWFAPHVHKAAKSGKVEHLIEISGKKINFEKIFLHYMKSYLDSACLNYSKVEIEESYPSPNKIAFIHIDSPKFYEEFKVILYRFFPQTKAGCVIVFQDFFYEWSATIILPIAILIDKGVLSLESSAATSLVCRVNSVPSQNDINEVDNIMNDKKKCEGYFDVAITACNKIRLDRPELYLPRITLAKIQWLYSAGHFNEARKTIVKYLKDGNPFQLKLIDTFLELLANGFSIRHLFEKDHSNDDVPRLAGAGKFERDKSK